MPDCESGRDRHCGRGPRISGPSRPVCRPHARPHDDPKIVFIRIEGAFSRGRALASWRHSSPFFGSELGGDLGRRLREGSGEERKRRHIPPLCSTFWREDDEGSHSLRGVFGSVIRPPTFEGVSFMLDLVVFTHSIERFVVMNN